MFQQKPLTLNPFNAYLVLRGQFALGNHARPVLDRKVVDVEQKPKPNRTTKRLDKNREAIRILVADFGYNETAKRTGIKAATLRQWSKRYGWQVIREHSQAATVTSVTKPSEIHRETLSDLRDTSTANLAQWTAGASAQAATEADKLGKAKAVRDVAYVHSVLWPQAQSKPLLAIALLTGDVAPKEIE